MDKEVIRLAIFGSTGSIGKSALDIVRKYPERFKVTILAANSNLQELEKQIAEFKPAFAGLSDLAAAETLKSKINHQVTKIFAGEEVAELAELSDYDVMLAAVVGFSGLKSVLRAAKAGKVIALANKESLVAGGELLLREVESGGARLLPVDSEHSAIYQLLQGKNREDLESITLTASGGPFFRRDLKDFETITPEESLKHPRWKMGSKVTLDSASMFNKGLELIEARWLFDLNPQNIEVIIHPQSIIHSMINFKDGSTFAHLSDTDMKGAIAYAINMGHVDEGEKRLPGVLKKLDFAELKSLEFFKLENDKFPAVELARSALAMGKAAGAVLNAANEMAGSAFLAGKISFRAIYDCVNDALSQFGRLNYSNYEDLIEIDEQVKDYLKKEIF
jgi:1-deoxy-D-xylulose-5-phosphate reductoisomerase